MASSVRRRQLGPFAVRSTEILIAEGGEEHHTLRRSVGALDLTALGVGAIIGTGIFVVIGEGAGEAGPAVTVSFVLAAVTCLFSALSYAELASADGTRHGGPPRRVGQRPADRMAALALSTSSTPMTRRLPVAR